MSNVRKYTNQLLEMSEQGLINKDDLIRNLLSYMSESDVQDFVECNEYVEVDDEEES